MSADILDSILSSNKSNISTGLQKVVNFVGKHGLAQNVGGKAVVGTTCGFAGIGALKPATELMEKAINGDKKARGYIARMKKRSDSGDPQARGAMGVLDVAAMALRDQDFPEQYQGDFSTQFSPGFESMDWAENRGQNDEVEFGAGATTVIDSKGKRRNFKTLAAAKAWMAKNPGSRVLSAKRTPGQRPGTALSAAQAANRQQRSPYATQGQVQGAISRVPPTKRQAFVSQIQQQQAYNMQQGMGQPVYPGQAGYPWPQGSANYGQPYYAPGAQGYAPGMGPGGYGYGQPAGMYGVATSTYGGPGMFATEDFVDDGSFYEEPAPGDVQFEDEGADSTEQTAAAME